MSENERKNCFKILLFKNSVNPDDFFSVGIQDPDPHQNQMDAKHCKLILF